MFGEETICKLVPGETISPDKALEVIQLQASVILKTDREFVYCDVAAYITGVGDEENSLVLEEVLPESAPGGLKCRRWEYRLSDGNVALVSKDGKIVDVEDREREYCDNCGEEIPHGQSHSYKSMPIRFSSGLSGESAVLCDKCAHFVQHVGR